MPFFEQVVLVEDGPPNRMIIERRYLDGSIQYWSMINLQVSNGQYVQPVQVPFKIDADSRQAAIDNFERDYLAAEPGAKESIQNQIEMANRKEKSKIVLANALPPTPNLQ